MSVYLCDHCGKRPATVHEAGCHLCVTCDRSLLWREASPKLSTGGSMIRPAFVLAALLCSPACSLTLPGTRNPTVEVARIMAEAQVATVQAITAALTKADSTACEVK